MVALTDSVIIKATPGKIFNALIKFFSSEKYYKMCHKDHTICKWIIGKPFEKGSVLYAEEYLHDKLHKMKFQHSLNHPILAVFRLFFQSKRSLIASKVLAQTF